MDYGICHESHESRLCKIFLGEIVRNCLYLRKKKMTNWQFFQNRWVKHPPFSFHLPNMSQITHYSRVKSKILLLWNIYKFHVWVHVEAKPSEKYVILNSFPGANTFSISQSRALTWYIFKILFFLSLNQLLSISLAPICPQSIDTVDTGFRKLNMYLMRRSCFRTQSSASLFEQNTDNGCFGWVVFGDVSDWVW